MSCAIKVLTNGPVHVSKFLTWFRFRWHSSGPSSRLPAKSAPMCTGPAHACRELARTRETRTRRVRACRLGAHVYRRPPPGTGEPPERAHADEVAARGEGGRARGRAGARPALLRGQAPPAQALPGGHQGGGAQAAAARQAQRGGRALAGAGAPAGAGAGPGELDRLRLEVATLREMLSDPKAGDPVRLSNRRKAELGERLRRDYGLPSDGS